MAKPWLLLALLALVHAKDDGFDYSEGEDDPERHMRLADVVQAESKLYNEPWSSTDQSIIRMNHGINTNQPPRVPRFTKEGFKKFPVPRELWSLISNYYELYKGHEQDETNIVGYLNNNRVHTKMVPISEEIRQRTFTDMGRLLSEWIDPDVMPKGVSTELHGTACYGIRKYVRDSTLQRHVDRQDTHAVSAIINVAQNGLEEPWPLEIVDHSGENHRVTIAPGEAVAYESAKLVHGRPHPLKGDAYYNLFVHFRPETGWDY